MGLDIKNILDRDGMGLDLRMKNFSHRTALGITESEKNWRIRETGEGGGELNL